MCYKIPMGVREKGVEVHWMAIYLSSHALKLSVEPHQLQIPLTNYS